MRTPNKFRSTALPLLGLLMGLLAPLALHADGYVEPTNTPVPTPYVVPPATGGITVDGSLTETAWAGSTIVLANPAFGESHGVTATLKVRWDATYYYVGLEVAEPASLRYASPTANIWDTNAVEIFLDMNHSKSTNLQAADFQYIVGLNVPTLFERLKRIQGVKFATKAFDDRWTAEVAIPWALLGKKPAKGLSIGFDVAVDVDTKLQDGGGGERETQLIWAGNINDYADASRYGTCTLSDK
ncbi:MAG TPA: sugar-binding protein [bacterium]|jgi:hypothetical protein|nr:sugar-binding protein [bacterium]